MYPTCGHVSGLCSVLSHDVAIVTMKARNCARLSPSLCIRRQLSKRDFQYPKRREEAKEKKRDEGNVFFPFSLHSLLLLEDLSQRKSLSSVTSTDRNLHPDAAFVCGCV